MKYTSTRHETLMVAILITATILISFQVFRSGASADLMALYLAGQQFAAGNLDQIYTQQSEVFDLSVPASWHPLAAAHGLPEMRLFPYIYPPIWAALAGKLTGMVSPASVFLVSHIANPILLAATLVLSWRIIRPSASLSLWMLIGLPAVFLTIFGFIALHQSQPQILVSFLIVLAIERSRANRPISAGAALALAASIKLYPVLFIVIWLAWGEWRAVKSFIGFGLALALASLAVGGIDLHLTFLRQIAIINDTMLLTQLTLNLDSFLGQFYLKELLLPNAQAVPGQTSPSGLHALKPTAFSLISKLMLLTTMILIWRSVRNSTEDRVYQNIWPALLILVSVFSPLSWAYHYISAAVFLPMLILSGPRKPEFLLSLTVLCSLSIPSVKILASLPTGFFLVQAVGTIGLALLAAMFLWRDSR